MRLCLAVLMFLCLMLGGCAHPAPPDEPACIRLSYNALPFNVPSIVAKEKGFIEQALQDAGFNKTQVEYATFGAGYEMSEAIAANKLDIACVTGLTSAILARAGDRPVRILSGYATAPGAFALVTRAGQKTTVRDLKGKTVGLPMGSEAHLLLAEILASEGMKLQDLHLVHMLVPDAAAALNAGSIDAAMLVDPVLTKLEVLNKIDVLRDGEGLIAGLTVTVVREDFLEQGGILDAYSKAMAQSREFIVSQKNEALSLAAAETGLTVEIARRVMDKYAYNPDIDKSTKMEMEKTIQFLLNQGILKERITVDELLAPQVRTDP